MAFGLETDTVIKAIRTTVGTDVTVGADTIPIRSKPEGDLYTISRTGRFPMLMIEVEENDSPGDDGECPILYQPVHVTVRLHFVARNEDMEASAIGNVVEYCRKASEAISEKVGVTSKGQLGTSILTRGTFLGDGRDYGAAPFLQEQTLTAYTSRWMFRYEVDRPT